MPQSLYLFNFNPRPLAVVQQDRFKVESFICINCINMGAETQTGADYEDLMKPFSPNPFIIQLFCRLIRLVSVFAGTTVRIIFEM